MKQNLPDTPFTILKDWFIPRSSDPTVRYRERALRFLLPFIIVLRCLAINNNYSGKDGVPTPYAPQWMAMVVFIVPILFSFIFLNQQKVDRASASHSGTVAKLAIHTGRTHAGAAPGLSCTNPVALRLPGLHWLDSEKPRSPAAQSCYSAAAFLNTVRQSRRNSSPLAAL